MECIAFCLIICLLLFIFKYIIHDNKRLYSQPFWMFHHEMRSVSYLLFSVSVCKFVVATGLLQFIQYYL